MIGLVLFLLPQSGCDVRPSDIHRFPFAAEACEHRWKFSRDHYEWVRKARPDDFEWIEDARRRAAIWDQLDNAKRYFVTTVPSAASQRCSLLRLKTLLGERDYMLGIVPEPAPFDRFVDR